VGKGFSDGHCTHEHYFKLQDRGRIQLVVAAAIDLSIDSLQISCENEMGSPSTSSQETKIS
jgi:hypothetical protein